MTNSLKQRRHVKRGAAAVEFAVTAPVFFLFLAYEGARAAMVPGATATDAKAKADSILKIVGARGAKVTITPSALTPTTTEVTVAVDVPMRRNGLIVPRFTSKTTLHSESTLRTERAE
jgi:hypothetical protein